MNAQQIAALNAAGEALKDLGLGRVRLSYLPACAFVPCETYVVFLEDRFPGLIVGTGDSAAEALDKALAECAERNRAKAA